MKRFIKLNEGASKKDISKKVNDLLSMMKGAGNILEDIRKTDPNFDAGYKIDAGISRASAALEEYAKEQNKEFDFEDLKFANYKLVDDIDTSARNAWFGKEGNEEGSIHIYTPEFVNIDLLPSDDYKYIVIVEIFKDCEHYKTLVIDAKTWITDSENLGIERNLKDIAEYILAWGFKDKGRV